MAKTCLNKLSASIAVGCTIPRVGVKDIYLMHAEDIKVGYHTDGLVSGVTFAEGAKSYKIEGYKQNIQVTASLKTTDVSARADVSVTFKVPYNYSNRPFINALALGKFCVLVRFNDDDYTLTGDVAPLECSSVEFDSNTNAKMVTITLASQEGSAGNCLRSVPNPVVDTIISKSV